MEIGRSKNTSPCEELIETLSQFIRLKKDRWEQVEDSIQMTNRLGSPSEDWIIPPDEKNIEALLMKDPDYLNLKTAILKLIPQVTTQAKQAHFDLKHKLEWVKFTDPLIGGVALNDALEILTTFKQQLRAV